MNVYDYEDMLNGREKVNLTGKTFCFSGRMRRYKGDLEWMVTNFGGVVKGSVVKKLDYLVIPDYVYVKSSKQINAELLGTVKIIKEAEFLVLVSSSERNATPNHDW